MAGENVAGLIFDCDGTLVNTPPIYARAWEKGFAESGVRMPAEWFMARAGMSDHVLMDAFASDFKALFDRKSAVRTMRKAFFEDIGALTEIDHVARIARDNHGRRPMAVASGGARIIVESCLEATGLIDLFDAIVTIEDVAHPKPAPDLFLRAAEVMGVSPAECMVFEDTPSGLEAASRAGMRGIDITKFG
ncbi:HAD family hydrolase [Gluconacetobacter tumulisoli]|uniref:HAD family phosphatase n=1 Tax=Gluconacetobacter tumulisoli TaxID=1286189 RepID=A0A7W4K5B3_9PROT|nr:HAD family phosphatase [Gluconacetobacter tumulisoli]MBB2200674.1 HAD family phosphatase [Gluconacetobacter tumulisoli]